MEAERVEKAEKEAKQREEQLKAEKEANKGFGDKAKEKLEKIGQAVMNAPKEMVESIKETGKGIKEGAQEFTEGMKNKLHFGYKDEKKD